MLSTSESDAYLRATSPLNSSSVQAPTRVASIASPDELVSALSEVSEVAESSGGGLEVVVQATGHGAGPGVDEHTVLFDMSALTMVSIDPDARVATVGAGATWSAVNTAAEAHGLLGLAGSSPSVSVAGYTFGGGIGWLVRRDGLASGALRAVHYVDGAGRFRVASEDADDPADRDALWVFRGAGGAGIAHTLEFDLFPAPSLHAGALLWRGEDLPAVLDAWAENIAAVGPSVSSSIGVINLPPAPVFPEEIRGGAAVHLAIADPDGPDGARSLLEALRQAAAPVSDTWGPTDAAGLARIHLDPPVATPAIGDARWLDETTPTIARDLLASAVGPGSGIVMMEIRHVSGAPTRRDGAVTTPPGGFIYHAVAPLDRVDRSDIEAGFARAREQWRSADAGVTPGSWVEGAGAVAEALRPEILERARAVADAIDPAHLIRRSRLLG